MACRPGSRGLLALIIDVNIPNHVDATSRGNHTPAGGATYERVVVMSATPHTGAISRVGRINRKSAVQAVVHRDLSLPRPLALSLSPSLSLSPPSLSLSPPSLALSHPRSLSAIRLLERTRGRGQRGREGGRARGSK